MDEHAQFFARFDLGPPLWLIWEATAHFGAVLLGSGSAKAAPAWFTPAGLVEVGLWIAVSCSAGLCEEVIFVDNLQRQFSAFTGNVWIGVICQAILFGLIHPFKGWRYVVLVAGLRVLYGILAALRKNLKPGMLAHGWSDI